MDRLTRNLPAPTPSIASPGPDQIDTSYWSAHYRVHLRHNLARASEYTRQHPSGDLIRHFGSFLTLLRQARRCLNLHAPAADLIAALTPWVQEWGYWDAWKPELDFAVQEFARQERPRRQAEMLRHLAQMLQLTGQLDQSLVVGEQAMALARAQCAPVTLARAGLNQAVILRSMEQPEQALALRKELEADLIRMTPHAPARDVTVAEVYLGWLDLRYLRHQGRMDEAVAAMSRAIARLEALSDTDPDLLAETYSERAIIYWGQGRYPDALRDLKRAISIGEGEGYSAAYNCGNLGLVYWSMSEYDQAADAFKRRIAACEEANDLWFLSRNLGNLGMVYLARGELDAAMRYLERNLALSTRLRDTLEVLRARGNRGIARACLGQYAEAVEDLTAWLDYLQHTGSRIEFALVSLNLSRCYAALGKKELALQSAEDGLQIGRSAGSEVVQGLALRCLADCVPRPERDEHLRRALDIARKYGRRLDEADCLLALAALAGETEEGERLWNQGAAVLAEIGAAAWLKDASPEQPPRLPTTGV
ncbi:MAG TPA: tetratricopeptide repeat protein [Thermoflexia bacterium]|nr:tetratricopeptide repeat protein [Thermoflexia bacterium]